MSSEPTTKQTSWDVFVDHIEYVTLTDDRHALFRLPRTQIALSCMPAIGTAVAAEFYAHNTYDGRDAMMKIVVADKIVDSQMSAWAFLNPSAPPKFMCVFPLGNIAAGNWYQLPVIRSGTRGGIVAEYAAFLDSLDCWLKSAASTPETNNAH